MKCHEQSRMNAKIKAKESKTEAPQKKNKVYCLFYRSHNFSDKQQKRYRHSKKSKVQNNDYTKLQFQRTKSPKDEIRFPPFVLYLLLPHDGDGRFVVG